jgi:glutaryl-CoA dehydrogenase
MNNQLQYPNIGRSLGTDYFHIADQLTETELDYWRRTRDFVDDEVLPVINEYWEKAELPWPLIKRMGELGIVGDGIEGYGCPAMSPLAVGLINMELNRGDGSLATFLGVQAGLAMQSIAMHGSEEQKQRLLPAMTRMEKLGAFALTEPQHGSDSVALETSARRDGDGWVINGQKKWIGNGSVADVVVLWARDEADGKVKGFLIEKGSPGYDAKRIDGKASLRAIWQAEITLTDVRVPEANRLPGANSFKTAAAVLAGTRNTVAWAGLGHAVAAYDIAAAYAQQRTQFGKPLVNFQIVQQRLVRMLAEVCSMQLYCLQLARLQERGALTDTIAALAKMNNTRRAREVIAESRDLLGGNGILLDYHVMRHMADIESLHTYEGTETIQTLIVGRDITGVGAFA